MSNYDDERQDIENKTYEDIMGMARKPADAAKNYSSDKAKDYVRKKIGGSASKKLAKQTAAKKGGVFLKAGVKALGTGLMNIGACIWSALCTLAGVFLAYGWIFIVVFIAIALIFMLVPALKQYTLDSLNNSPTVEKTEVELSPENQSMFNYYKFYSNRVLNENKYKITYKGIDEKETGIDLFEKLNKKEFILGPKKPLKITPPGNKGSTSSLGSDSLSSSESQFQQADGSYHMPEIKKIIKVEWDNPQAVSNKLNNTLKIVNFSGKQDKMTEEEILKHQFLVYDILSDTTVYMVRTMGTNHNDVEYSTAGDAQKMKNILGSKFDSWNIRPVFIIQGDTAIIATWTTANHAGRDDKPGLDNCDNRSGGYGTGQNLDYIKNGVDGHMDIYFHRGIGHKLTNYTPFYKLTESQRSSYWNHSKNYHRGPLIELENKVSNKEITPDSLNNSKWGYKNKSDSKSYTLVKNDENKDLNKIINFSGIITDNTSDTKEKNNEEITVYSNSNENADTGEWETKMEGFIATETIDAIQKQWEGLAKPDKGWTWDTSELRKKLNKTINDGYGIKAFEDIDSKDIKYDSKLNDTEKKQLKDKYGREEFFQLSPELIYSLNKYIFKEQFLHSESFIKPVKVNEDLWQLDIRAFQEGGFYTEDKRLEYGLGTVFIYRPVITFQIERGVEINQTASETTKKVKNDNDEGYTTITEYKSQPAGRILNNIDCKIEYVLERAITFQGEYVFTYEEDVSTINERNIVECSYDEEKKIYTGSLIQSKTYEVTERPKGIVFQNKGREYIEGYLKNFVTEIPKDVIESFNTQRIYNAFKYYDSEVENESFENSEGSENTGKGSSLVEQWRPLCEEIGKKYGIDPVILLMLVDNESSGNIHIDPNYTSYKGLSAMQSKEKLFTEYVLDWFQDGSEYKNYSVKDIWPNKGSCKKSKNCDLNDAEHQRVARFHIEYLATRLTKQMSNFMIKYKKINPQTDSPSKEIIQECLFFSVHAYNTGEGGQNRMYKNYGLDLYKAPGTFYTEMHYKHCSDLRPDLNAKYLEKNYKKYVSYSGGPTLDKSAWTFEYDPTKWTKSSSKTSSSNSSTSTDNTIQEDKINFNMDLVNQYVKFEQGGFFRPNTRYSTSLDDSEIDLLLATATATREEITISEVEDGSFSFWDKDFLKENFVNGLPKGRSFEDYKNNKNVSATTWKKIVEMSNFLEKNIGKRSLGKVNPFNTSNLVGHAYYTYLEKSIPRSPLALARYGGSDVSSDEIILGDIAILTRKNISNSSDTEDIIDSGGISEIAMYLGNDFYLWVDGGRIMKVQKSIIEDRFKILKYIRPIKSDVPNNPTTTDNVDFADNVVPGEYIWPTNATIYGSPFGYRIHPVLGTRKMHTGIDISRQDKSHKNYFNYATKDGVVIQSGVRGGYGNCVEVDHGNGITSLYAHGASNSVKVGDQVKQGQKLQVMGTTGMSTGIHLHFEIRVNGQYKDPIQFLSIPSNVKI